MKKIICKEKKINRHDLANPFRHMSYHERFRKANTIDLEDNFTIEDLGNGYGNIKPVDKSKTINK